MNTINAVRSFNRFYTRHIGILREGLLNSPYSLSQIRVLYELANRQSPTASELCQELGLDPGYLSRLLRLFEKGGLVRRVSALHDGRQAHLHLSRAGRRVFDQLNTQQNSEVASMLRSLSPTQQRDLSQSLRKVQQLLGATNLPRTGAPYTLRPLQPGDIGWVIHRHGVLYAAEHHYDEHFEALVAGIAADYVNNYDPQRERCWIAEQDGQIAGFVFLVKESQTVAKLRLLLVEPWARGLGIGKGLVTECIQFSRQARYKKIVLWTQSDLPAARHLYQEAGFQLIEQKPHHSWGRDLVAEIWQLKL